MVREQVLRILAHQAQIPVSDLKPEARPADLGLNSLALVESIFAIEEAFDIQVPFNANTANSPQFDISTIGAIVDAVENLVWQKAG